nr:hypothetical protein CFP56_69302 [Quercus suber]
MEVTELVKRTNRCSFQDIRLELPPNQAVDSPPENTIIGKLISPKSLSLPIIKDVVTKAWRPTYPLEVSKLDNNVFLFKFHHEADAQKTLLKRPWSIRGGHLILKEWDPSLTWKEVDFSKSVVWVQVHGLPSLWLSEMNLRTIGAMAGEVLELDLSGEGGAQWRRFTRIKVNIDIEQPLLPGVFLPRPNLDDLWVSLKYEKISQICYICGIIGHDEKDCGRDLYKLQNPFGVQFEAAGSWLRPENDHSPIGVYDKPTKRQMDEDNLNQDATDSSTPEYFQEKSSVYPPQGQLVVEECSEYIQALPTKHSLKGHSVVELCPHASGTVTPAQMPSNPDTSPRSVPSTQGQPLTPS